MPTLLLVDDDRALIDCLTAALSGYRVVNASDGLAALHQLHAERPNLVLLDLRMPVMDGAVLLGKIRAISRVPVIVLSARHEQQDVVQALKYADDFIKKPFDLEDLEARIEAVLRRCGNTKLPAMPDHVATVGGLSIASGRAATLNGKPLHLTRIEHALAEILARHEGKVLTRTHLTETIWGFAPDTATSHMIDTHVGRLRIRLRKDGAPRIVTVRGQGFLIQAPPALK